MAGYEATSNASQSAASAAQSMLTTAAPAALLADWTAVHSRASLLLASLAGEAGV